MRHEIRRFMLFSLLLLFGAPLYAGTGTEGANFLNTPVGAEPAALAGAYSALASDAYAPVWNPGGLGQIDSFQLTAQHLSSLETLSDTHLGFVYPLKKGRAFGASFRYIGSGNISETDTSGNSAGTFTSHYGAYALAYGQTITDKLSLGISGKIIDAKIAEVGATAYAVDFGSFYQATEKLSLAGVISNFGSDLTFIEQHDPLPLAFHLGSAYKARPDTTVAIEGVYRQTGLASLHAGLEWSPIDQISLRIGYRTDTLKGLSPLAGLTTGIGLKVFGQTFSYAWLPMGDLGSTQYISLLFRFNNSPIQK